MRVIVTRPATGAHRTAERLSDLGHEPILLPLSVAEHFPDSAAQALDETNGTIAITSAEAIRALQALRERDPAGLKQHVNRPLYAVGAASAQAARAFGFRAVTAGGGTGEALAAQMVAAKAGHVLYLAGRPRSAGFERGLEAGGIGLRTVEVYAMRPQEITAAQLALLTPRPDAVLFYSREAVRLFLANAALRQHLGDLSRMSALCLSATIAEAIPAGTFASLGIAAAPAEEDLLLLL